MVMGETNQSTQGEDLSFFGLRVSLKHRFTL